METESTASSQHERSDQTLRTRRAIIAAARDIMRDDQSITIAEVARAALVSEAALYQLFPDLTALLRVAVDDLFPDPTSVLTDATTSTDPKERISCVTEILMRALLANETTVRLAVASFLVEAIDGSEPSGRPAPRIGLIDEALRPVQGTLDDQEMRRLELALYAIVSAETLLTLKDVSSASDDEIIEVVDWAAQTIVGASLDGLAT